MQVKDIIKNNLIWIPGESYEKATPKLSIIMPTYGRGNNGFFKRAVQSFMKQTLEEIELIIIDDENIDKTPEQIKELMAEDGRISCIKHKNNMGLPSVSAYEGYLRAKGEYIGFLFDDCVVYPTAYQRTLEIMEERNALISYGRCFVHTDKRDMKQGQWLYYGEESLENLEINNLVANLTLICHRKVFEKIGWYDPHICMLRINDWDMVLRMKRQFEIIETGVKFGEEYGITQKNSLGNSAIIDHESIIEHMNYYPDRNNKLLVKNYENYDVLASYEGASLCYKQSVDAQTKRFHKKEWFKRADYVMNLSADQGFVKDVINIAPAGGDLTVSEYLVFNKLYTRNKEIYAFPCYMNLLAQSRAVIVSRAVVDYTEIIRKAKSAKIPIYLFWDDNFIELAKSEPSIAYFSEEYGKNFFKNFEGIIVPNKEFYNNFKKKKYHKNILLCEITYPKLLEQQIPVRNSKNDPINICYLGGNWRSKALLKYVLPALERLSEKYEIRLICPDYDDIRNKAKKAKYSFEIEYIPKTFSVEQMIFKYAKHNIHIQVHPSTPTDNNDYKTKNALINASLLGATLVASDDAPYNNIEKGEENTFVLAGDSVADWERSLEQLIKNDSKRCEIINKARLYCSNRYNGESEDQLVKYILDNTSPVDYIQHIDRTMKIGQFDGGILYGHNSPIMAMKSQPILNLRASERIQKGIKYKVKSPIEVVSEIEVMFGTHMQLPEGKCEVKLWSMNNECIYKTEMDLSEVEDNEIYKIDVDSVTVPKNQYIYLEFCFEYENDTLPISIYENNDLFPNNRIIRKAASLIGKKGSLYVNFI